MPYRVKRNGRSQRNRKPRTNAANFRAMNDEPLSVTRFWKSQRIDANWDRKPMLWELLWELASRAQRGLAVDRDNLSNRKSQRAIRDRRSDLGGLLPPALDERIVNAGRYTYRLELPPQDISLFVHEDEGRWTEDGGTTLDSAFSAASRNHS